MLDVEIMIEFVFDYMSCLGCDVCVVLWLFVCVVIVQKNCVLLVVVDVLDVVCVELFYVNEQDFVVGCVNGLELVMLDCLVLILVCIDDMIEGLCQVVMLFDLIGEICDMCYVFLGIQIGKMCVLLGVVGIIYELWLNVIIDVVSLCLKFGNVIILCGGFEVIYFNQVIVCCIQQGLVEVGLLVVVVQVVEIIDCVVVGVLISMFEYVDVIVLCGGKGLIECISCEVKVLVIKYLDGICYVYIDVVVDLDKVICVVDNVKIQCYVLCNIMEMLLVYVGIVEWVLLFLVMIYCEKGVELCGDVVICVLFGVDVLEVIEEDWCIEYNVLILLICIVDGLDVVIEYINIYGLQYIDVIIIENFSDVWCFFVEVDFVLVMVNVLICFVDGFEYGFGVEIGIFIDKLYVCGLVGLEGLISEKYVVFGDGYVCI